MKWQYLISLEQLEHQQRWEDQGGLVSELADGSHQRGHFVEVASVAVVVVVVVVVDVVVAARKVVFFLRTSFLPSLPFGALQKVETLQGEREKRLITCWILVFFWKRGRRN